MFLELDIRMKNSFSSDTEAYLNIVKYRAFQKMNTISKQIDIKLSPSS